MLTENIKIFRESKGLSQEELAVKLNVVRQTVSKWERGLSVPDADLLVGLSEALETPVSTLLGETVEEPKADSWKAIAEKLEVINLQLARREASRRRTLHWMWIALGAGTVLGFAALAAWGSPYQGWDFGDPELALAGTAFHAFEWLYVRAAPLVLTAACVGAFLTRRKAR